MRTRIVKEINGHMIKLSILSVYLSISILYISMFRVRPKIEYEDKDSKGDKWTHDKFQVCTNFSFIY